MYAGGKHPAALFSPFFSRVSGFGTSAAYPACSRPEGDESSSFSRTIPRVLRWSYGGEGAVSYERDNPVSRDGTLLLRRFEKKGHASLAESTKHFVLTD